MLHNLYGVLLPFFASFLIAYILAPIVDFVQVKCRVRIRVLAVLITLIVISLLLFGAVAALMPLVTKEVAAAKAGLEEYFANFDINNYLTPELQQRWQELSQNLDFETVLSYPQVQDAISGIVPKIAGWVSGGLSWATELVVIFIGLLYLIFLLIDFPRIRANWLNYVPKRFRKQAVVFVDDLDRNMNAYFRGQAVVALIVGILFSIGFSIIGMPMGVAMGLIIGVLNLVPYMQALGIPPCILLCLLQSAQTGRSVWLALLLMAVVFLVVQSIQDMVLTPKIMGKVTGLGPAAILLSLSIWGALFGVLGMIVALPLTTLGISYYKLYVLKQSDASVATASDTGGKPLSVQAVMPVRESEPKISSVRVKQSKKKKKHR